MKSSNFNNKNSIPILSFSMHENFTHACVGGCLSEVNCKKFKYDELDDMNISLDYTGDWREHKYYDMPPRITH